MFADAQMQPHVQERVGFAAFNGEITVEIAADGLLILGVIGNDLCDLCLER